MSQTNEFTYDRINDYAAVKISLAKPSDIRGWSYGEVKKPETINYRTYRPERDGLFCEKIFGPEKDWECACGKYRGMKYKGMTCDRCGVKITHSRVRRKRMGHVDLAAPVVHIWFFKAASSRLATLLSMKASSLEKVIYFQDYVVIDPKETPLKTYQLLSEEEYRKARDEYGSSAFEADMGAEAIRKLLQRLDLVTLSEELRQEMTETKSKQRKKDLINRLKLVESLRDSDNQPEWMVLDAIPVIPPDLRPLVLLESGTFATSDLNDLYRRIINRNTRLKKLVDLNAPEVIIRNEKRMLQQAVDALFDNGRCKRPVLGSSNRPLKSLTDMIKGKQGRFRENLLGKRVDYSARSVIVVGPHLRLHQCGLPKKIALELFQPFIIRRLKELQHADTIKSAKKMLERKDEEVWDILEEVIQNHPVLLNRAPTLHRMGIQAFEPTLVEGNAIKLHPLVCRGFNADFDGDQMAVHLPLSLEAQVEAHTLMLSTNNVFSPANGAPIISPSQDIVMGCYYVTMARPGVKGEGMAFSSFEEALLAHAQKKVDLHAKIWVRMPRGKWLKMTDFSRQKEFYPTAFAADDSEKKLFEEVYQRDTVYMDLIREAMEIARKALADIRKVQSESKPVLDESQPVDPLEFRRQRSETEEKIRKIREKAVDQLNTFENAVTHVRKRDLSEMVEDLRLALDINSELVDVTPIESRLAAFQQYLENDNDPVWDGEPFVTTPGRIIFNNILPKGMPYYNEALKAGLLQAVISNCHEYVGRRGTIDLLDNMMRTGFEESTRSGLSFATDDLITPEAKLKIIEDAEKKVAKVYRMYEDGIITEVERYNQVLDTWTHAREEITKQMMDELKKDDRPEKGGWYVNPIHLMATSGARGGTEQIRQLAGMRGLMAKPNGKIIETPIKANFREGLTVLEYFSSTHGARKGLADTALKTADSGYLTRKLADVAQNVVITQDDCGTTQGITKGVIYRGQNVEVSLADSIKGRVSRANIVNPITDEVIVRENEMITTDIARKIEELGLIKIQIRSPMTCEAELGVCAKCYGMDLSTSRMVEEGLAVGIIAAQSIGEPGTQLTMRTFHIGGVAARGLETNEVRTKFPGTVKFVKLEAIENRDGQRIALSRHGSVAVLDPRGRELESYAVPIGANVMVKEGDYILPPYEPQGKSSAAATDPELKVRLKLANLHSLEKKIGDVKWSPAVADFMKKRGFSTLADLLALTKEDLEKTDVLDTAQKKEILDKMKESGLSLEDGGAAMDVIVKAGDKDPKFFTRDIRVASDGKKESVRIGDRHGFLFKNIRIFADFGGKDRKELVFGKSASDQTISISKYEFGNRGVTIDGKPVEKVLPKCESLEIVITGGSTVCTWDPHSAPILAKVSGKVRYVDIVDDETVRKERDLHTGKMRRSVAEIKDARQPQIDIVDEDGKGLDFYYLPGKAVIEVEDGAFVERGTLLAKTPREASGTQDITGGLPRVTEIFEARKPKDPAVIAEIDGLVSFGDKRHGKRTVVIKDEDTGAERIHEISHGKHMRVHTEDFIKAGQAITDGPLVPHDILRISGEEAVQEYLVREIQNVYRSQRVKINDKHIEIIVSQMLRKVKIEAAGDTKLLEGIQVDKFQFKSANRDIASCVKIVEQGGTELLPGTIIPRDDFERYNDIAIAEGGQPATCKRTEQAQASTQLLGITKAAVQSSSFISAASFQETTKVLTEAALASKTDNLIGLKENVILGHLVPAGTGFRTYHNAEWRLQDESAEDQMAQIMAVTPEVPRTLLEDDSPEGDALDNAFNDDLTDQIPE